jgi:hypothetical protein
MKELCDQLEAAQGDHRRYAQLLEHIRTEAAAFQRTFATHDIRG